MANKKGKKSSSSKKTTYQTFKSVSKSINKMFPGAKSQEYDGPTFNPEEFTGTYEPTEFTKEYNPEKYDSKYLPQIEEGINNLTNWNYDPLQDASYQALAKVYGARGNIAAKNSLADAAALNGGYGTSYAVSAAQQTRNQYNQELASLVPQLEQASYDRQAGATNMLMGLDDSIYGRFSDDEARKLQSLQYALDVAGFNEGNKQFAANYGLDVFNTNTQNQLAKANFGLDTWQAGRDDYWTGKNYKADNMTTALSTGLNYLGYKDDHAIAQQQLKKLKGVGSSSGGGRGGRRSSIGGGGGIGGYTSTPTTTTDTYTKATTIAADKKKKGVKSTASGGGLLHNKQQYR